MPIPDTLRASHAQRLRAAALVAVGAASLGIWAACSLPEEGLLGGGSDTDGSSTADVPPLPQGCTTLDASCLGILPTGWRPVSVNDAGACGADFEAGLLHVNPSAGLGACACGACQPVGAYTCTNAVAISGGNSCNDPTLANAVPGSCTLAHAQHLEAHPSDATGSVACVASNDAGTGATSDTLTVCVPGCSADFCGGASRCILADGDVTCPAGFQLFAKAGTGVDPGCAPCACEAGAPGTCGGTVTGFESNNCADGGLVHTYDLGTCNVFDNNTDYSSVIVNATPPDASCFPSPLAQPDLGDASLTGLATICCQ